MSKQLLSGVRVLDLTAYFSGPYCTSILGALGAEIIKVESIQHPDAFRFVGPVDPSEPKWYEKGAQWVGFNTNKRGITLNLMSASGRDIFLDLIKKADIVIDNFAPRVMGNFGFAYPRLKEINSRLIMIQLSCFGQTGPWRDFVGFGFNFDQLGGAAALTGYEDGSPLNMNGSSDAVAGITAVYAILLALRERDRTGRGQYIDISQVESLMVFMGKQIIDYQVTGMIQRRMGNHHPVFAPHNAYPCLGEDNWVIITVTSDDEWAGLARAMGKPAWIDDHRFATILERKRNESEIDDLVGKWTKGQNKNAVMELLQSHGVPAGALLHCGDLPKDPHFRARGMFKKISREFVGEHVYPQFPLHFSDAFCEQRTPSPTLGQHTEEVLSELAGITSEEMVRLREEKIIGLSPLGL